MKLSIGGKIGAGLGLALLILLIIGAVSFVSMAGLIESAHRLASVHEALYRLMDLCAEVEQAKDFDAYYGAVEKVGQAVQQVRSLASADRAPAPELDALERVVAPEVAAARQWTKLAPAERSGEAARGLSPRGQRDVAEEIRKVVAEALRRQPDRSQRWREGGIATARRTVLIIGGGTTLAFALMAALGWLVLRGIGVSVRRLVEATEQIGSGRLDVTVPVSAVDELGRLGAALGGMVERLQQAHGNFQDQIRTLQFILDNLSDGVIVADGSGDTQLANPAALRLLGLTAVDGRLDKNWERKTLYLPDGVTPYPLDQLPLTAALRGKPVEWTEVAVRTADHPEGRWLSVSAQPLRRADGSLSGAVAILHEVTEQRRAETALRESECLLKSILDTLPVGVWITDTAGNITMANPASHRIWGGVREVTAEQYEHYCAWWSKTHERMLAQDWPLARAVATGAAAVGDPLEIEAFDGSHKTVEQTVAPLRDLRRQLFGFVVVCQDISVGQQRDTQIKDLVQELRQRARDLEAVNKELEAFSWSVSHDLRAPLRSIEGFSRALMEDHAGQLNDEARDYLQRVCSGALRMGQLIDDLLRLSRVTRSEIRLTTVDLSALAHSILTELARTQPEREVEFTVAPGLVVNADAQLLRIVMENLLGNAWKFTSKQARAKIEVGRAPWQGQLMYFVRDNGAGFDMAYADKLFGAFQRLHPVYEFEGTGIGLATVQRILHRHGGRISAEGAVGQGATFYFTLP